MAGGLGIGEVLSAGGDIILSTPDSIELRELFYLGDGAFIRAIEGSVTLQIGDVLTAEAGSVIEAAQTVSIEGDYFRDSDVDPGAGAVVNLLGAVDADSVQITGGADEDVVILTNVGSTTTIDTGGGDDIIRVGSRATEDSNTGGVMDQVKAMLTVRGGGGSDRLEMDDSGDTRANDGILASDAITGLGMSNVVKYEQIEDLQIALGSSADSLLIESTHSDTTATIDTGAGDDTVTLRARATRSTPLRARW